MRYTKPPVSFPNQLQKLKNRGLIVPDDATALRYLSTITNQSENLKGGDSKEIN